MAKLMKLSFVPYKYQGLAVSAHSLTLLSLLSFCLAVSGTCSRLVFALVVRPFVPSRRLPVWNGEKKRMLRRYINLPKRLTFLNVPIWLLVAFGLLFFEAVLHWKSLRSPRPDHDLDRPFYTSCQEPNVDAPRENAVLVMLARNSEVQKAKHSIDSIERKFNRWFHYPVLFLNNEPWSEEFIQTLNSSVSGEATFEVIPEGKWGFPEYIDPKAARASFEEQEALGVKYGGMESYHHMCRFFSGEFYMLEALEKYKWYWRVEPDVDFSCSITYDPFVEMARHKKTYGFTIGMWEIYNTVPSLYRETAEWKEALNIPTTNLWKTMTSASWAPWPFRSMMGWLPYRDRHGDLWTSCHYWSNFEIADLDFFRGRSYQEYYKYLDRRGGFYFERWGDASVHSLAIGMLLDATKVHHFEDVGYVHDNIFECPANAPGGQLPDSKLLGPGSWATELDGGFGCRCECDGRLRRNQPSGCLDRLKAPNTVRRTWLPSFPIM